MVDRSPSADPESGQRTHMAHVRLADAEWEALVTAAAVSGHGRTAAWMRETLLDAAATVMAGGAQSTRVEVRDALREIRGELARIGNNLNQIAKALNIATAGGGEAPELGRIEFEIERSFEVLTQCRAELSGR